MFKFLKSFFGGCHIHRYEITVNRIVPCVKTFFGVEKQTDGRAVVKKCSICGKEDGFLIDKDGMAIQKDVAILKYNMGILDQWMNEYISSAVYPTGVTTRMNIVVTKSNPPRVGE